MIALPDKYKQIVDGNAAKVTVSTGEEIPFYPYSFNANDVWHGDLVFIGKIEGIYYQIEAMKNIPLVYVTPMMFPNNLDEYRKLSLENRVDGQGYNIKYGNTEIEVKKPKKK